MSSETKHVHKQGFWREHSDAWKSSGLTQVAYCAQQGISYQSFVYQHNRIVCKVQRAPMGFVEAKPEAVAGNSPVAGLQLMLPSGIRIGITNEVNPVLLKTVLTIVGDLSC
ncbi:MAG: hypothetical protein Q8R79_02115 [Legionellaceae bacterium]|nr:hypothetical protein [Legionellaceae bacterium]